MGSTVDFMRWATLLVGTDTAGTHLLHRPTPVRTCSTDTVGVMSALAGPLFAAALLMALAGAFKLTRPDATRVALRTASLPSGVLEVRALGAVEVLGALAVVALGGRLAGAIVLVAYLGFAGFAAHLANRSRRSVPCGCFGSSSAPVGRLHVIVNLLLAVVGAVSIAAPTSGISSVVNTPMAGAPFVAFTLLLTWLLLVALTALPEVLAASRVAPRTVTR
jgi:hypothetical protein